ncbi:MAG TPA: amidase [Longimicrobiaceae bacterium]|nr:amidase [Longimicrobiaceae bacterium]
MPDRSATPNPRHGRRSLQSALGAVLTLAAGACAGQPPAVPTPGSAAAPFAYEEATIPELQDAMRSGRLTSHDLVEAYLARIQALDRAGPKLHAMLDLNPDALAIADSLDAERRAGHVRGPLHGIPVVIKDNIDTHDRMTTTAGSLALEGSVAPSDASVVRRLRDAGAVILGKTNLSEWANFRGNQSSSGWSGRGGQARNPYVLDRSPCGSSSGTGIAVAASMAAVGVGTETDGSVVCPSAMNGLVGIKPTVGLVSRSGIIPISHNQDTAGPMARTVTDAAILLGAIAGADARDDATAASAGRIPPDYTRFLDADGLRGARIGVARARFTGYSPEADSVFEAAVAAMRRAGAVIVDSVEIPHAGEYGGDEFTVLLYDFKHDLNAYLAGLGPDAPVRTLADVIAFNREHAARELRYFGQELMEQAQAKGPLTDTAYTEALARARRLSRLGIDSVLRAEHLDAIVAPTVSPAWTIDLVNGDHDLGGSSSPAAVAGYPSITVPAGFAHGLPVGVSFFASAWQEPRLLRLAYAFEQATKARRAPRFLPTIGDDGAPPASAP